MDQWIWISWERHRRTSELSKDLGIRLFDRALQLPRWIKHPYLLMWTLYLLLKLRPRGVVVQNPSIVLALWAVLLKGILGYALVVDAHNAGLEPYNSNLKWAGFIYCFAQRKADITIVTNTHLADRVRRAGGNPFVLEDKLPVLPEVQKVSLKGRTNIACISTFAKDEPFLEIIEAAKLLNEECCVYVTGNSKGAFSGRSGPLPRNIILTGYLPGRDYLALLRSADVVMDLTKREDCLVCGAYEAVALEKPLILSDTAALQSYFHVGAIYTKNVPEEIAKAISKAVADLARLREEITGLRKELEALWGVKREKLITLLRTTVEGP